MSLFEYKRIRRNEGGYIALISSIIIGAILLGIAINQSFTGWHARYNVLGTENKEKSAALAEGCADQSLVSLITNPGYSGENSVSFPNIGTCYVYPIDFDSPTDGMVTIKTQGDVQGSITNLQMAMNFVGINTGPTISQGKVIVKVNVTNNNGGTLKPSDVVVHSYGVNASPSTFSGSDSPGTTVLLDPGDYSIDINNVISYNTNLGDDCSGYADEGDVKICIINLDEVPTTLTISVNVTNDNGGEKDPGDFQIKLDGASVSQDIPIKVSPGLHTLSAPASDGEYSASTWGYDCSSDGTITITAGEEKTCIINYNDTPPPGPSCADTVMMLDRTGSLFNDPQDPINEGIAAKALLDLYKDVTPKPQVGIGSMGGLYVNGSNPASVPNGTNGQPYGWLTSNYGSDSLNDLIGPKAPTGVGSVSQWSNPTNAFSDDTLYATSATNNQQQIYSKFGVGNIPSGATITGIIVKPIAKASSPAQNDGDTFPSSTANYNNWSSTGTSNKVTAVNSNNGDSSYITISSSGSGAQQSFSFPNAGIPSGSTINSVTLYAYAKAASSGSSIQFMAERGTASGQQQYSSTINLSTSNYSLYSWTMNNNPFTSSQWTLTDVNSWNIKFGARKSNSTSAAPRITELYLVVNYTPPAQGSVKAELSWNNGASNSWTSGSSGSKNQTLNNIDNLYNLGNSNDKWGRNWTTADFADNKFLVRLTNTSSTGTTASLDYITVEVYYTIPSTGLYYTVDTMMKTSSSGAGSYLASAINAGNGELNSSRHDITKQKVLVLISDGVPSESQSTVTNAANAAKNGGTEIFTIHFGDTSGQSFLASLASDQVNSDTGLKQASSNFGNNNWSNPQNAYASDNLRATANSSSASIQYGNLGLAVPDGSVVKGIDVTVEGYTSGSRQAQISLSWNNGSSWTSTKTTNLPGTNSSSEATRTFGSSSDTWGRSWSGSDFNNFRLRLVTNSSSGTLNIDQVRVRVYYSVNNHFFIAPTSDDMKDIFETIGKLVCPAIGWTDPTPPPATGKITVITHVVNDSNSASKTAPDFNMTLATSTSISFQGAESPGKTFDITPGSYNVYGSSDSRYSVTVGSNCSSSTAGTIDPGESRVCTIVYDDILLPPSPNIIFGSWQEIPSSL